MDLCQFAQIVGVHYFLQLQVLHVIKYHFRPDVLDLLLSLDLHLFCYLDFSITDEDTYVVEGDPDDQQWHFILERASLK